MDSGHCTRKDCAAAGIAAASSSASAAVCIEITRQLMVEVPSVWLRSHGGERMNEKFPAWDTVSQPGAAGDSVEYFRTVGKFS